MHSESSSFKQSMSQSYPTHSDFVTCESIQPLPFKDGSQIALGLYHFGGDPTLGELAIHDETLQRVTATTWPGSCFAVQTLHNRESHVELALFGSTAIEGETDLLAPTIRIYRYDGETLVLEQHIHWQPQRRCFTAVKSGIVADLDGDGTPEILTFATTEARGRHPGFAELRIWSPDLALRHSFRWEVERGQNLSPWGCRAALGDLDGDGKLEIVAVLDFKQGNDSRIDVRLFDSELRLIGRNEALLRERHFSTGLCIGDIDADGSAEVVLVGGTFPKVRTGATSEILLLDSELTVQKRREWRTFRHSWVWDIQLATPDGDGRCEIVTLGGTAMDGRGQSDAHVFGELRFWDHTLQPRIHHVWQQEPGLDTRASRIACISLEDDPRRTTEKNTKETHPFSPVVVLKQRADMEDSFANRSRRDACAPRFSPAAWVAATSRWNDVQRGQETRLLRLERPSGQPAASQIERFIQAWKAKDMPALVHFADLEDDQWRALALEALADCGTHALPPMMRILQTPFPSLFRRATHRLRHLGDEAVQALHSFGFATPGDWLIASPFDNAENAGLDRAYPPETTLGLDEVWAGRGRLVRWSRIEGHPADVYIDLARLYYEPFQSTGIELGWNSSNTTALAYLLTEIQVESAVEADLRLSCCDGHRAWLNGILVSEGEGAPSAIPDQKVMRVTLQRGSNRLLLKVANHHADQWGCFVRITNSTGQSLPGLRYRRPKIESVHLEPFSQADLLALLDDTDEGIRVLAARELANAGDARGVKMLHRLLNSKECEIQAEAALALTRLGYTDGETKAISSLLAETAPSQSLYFQLEAGHVLRQIGDPGATQFALENLHDTEGQPLGEWRVEENPRQFNLFPMLAGKEIGDLRITLDRRFHLGEGSHARCASIRSFGLYSVDYRDRGLGKEAMRQLDQKLRGDEYACSTVGTGMRLVAHRLYRQQGYVDRRFPWNYMRSLQASDCTPADAPAVRVVPCEGTLGDEVRRLRHEYADHSVGPVDRATEPAVGPWIQVICLDDQAVGFAETALDAFEPVGYLNSLYLSPAVNRENLTRAALPLLHRYFLEAGRERIRFSDPALSLRELLLEQGYLLDPHCRTHGWVSMFKVVDLSRLLDEITPLLWKRLEHSRHAGWCGTISLIGSRLQAALKLHEEGIEIMPEPGGKASIQLMAEDAFLTQLVSGDGDLWEAYRQGQIRTQPSFNERIWTLLETLFPRMPWRHWGWW